MADEDLHGRGEHGSRGAHNRSGERSGTERKPSVGCRRRNSVNGNAVARTSASWPSTSRAWLLGGRRPARSASYSWRYPTRSRRRGQSRRSPRGWIGRQGMFGGLIRWASLCRSRRSWSTTGCQPQMPRRAGERHQGVPQERFEIPHEIGLSKACTSSRLEPHITPCRNHRILERKDCPRHRDKLRHRRDPRQRTSPIVAWKEQTVVSSTFPWYASI